MINHVVQSILARCLVDPAFLDAVSANANAALAGVPLSDALRLQFARLDWSRVRSFAALITKVQNNNIWQPFLATRLLMRHYGVETRLFEAFRGLHQANRRAGVKGALQARSFPSFLLSRKAAPLLRGHAGLRDVAAHELILFDLQKPAAASRSRRLAWPASPFAGALIVRSYTHDPSELTGTLRQRAFEGVLPGPSTIVYFASFDRHVLTTTRVDPLSGAMLDQLAGGSTLASLQHAARGAMRREVQRRLKAFRAHGWLAPGTRARTFDADSTC